MTYKTIFKGRLEFGSPKSYDKVLSMYKHRVENYYKADILLNESAFDADSASLNVPSLITQANEKTWKNTLSLLEYLSQFAVAGNLGAWKTEDGKVLQHDIFEPCNDRSVVQYFLKGRALSKECGRENEALQLLDEAIAKFERHAQAFERRGEIHLRLNHIDQAITDFTRSIEASAYQWEAYLGRARAYMLCDQLDAAISDLENAIKHTIPLQPNYWVSRRLKADCHMMQVNYDAAVFELKFFTKKVFHPEDPNYAYQRKANFDYGVALLLTGHKPEAMKAFEAALLHKEGSDQLPDAEINEWISKVHA